MRKIYQNNQMHKSYKPVFSVIMPTKDRCFCIWKAILSVVHQTYPFWELIIINDASGDKTQETIEQFSDPRIRCIINKKTKGASACRNQGLKKAQGKYIAYLDDDNLWHNEFLEIMHNAYKVNPEKVVVFCKKNFRLNIINSHQKIKAIRNEFTNHKKHFDLKRLWQRKILIDTNTLTHNRQKIIKLGGWDTNLDFWEDYEFTLNISSKYPDGFLSVNRTLVDYEQTIDFSNQAKTVKKWEKAEKYIFNKHKKSPYIKHQKWYPAEKHKSTLSVVKFLQSKKVG